MVKSQEGSSDLGFSQQHSKSHSLFGESGDVVLLVQWLDQFKQTVCSQTSPNIWFEVEGAV